MCVGVCIYGVCVCVGIKTEAAGGSIQADYNFSNSMDQEKKVRLGKTLFSVERLVFLPQIRIRVSPHLIIRKR